MGIPLVARPLPLLRACLLHQSPSPEKIPCFFSPFLNFCLPQCIRIRLSCYLPLRHALSGPCPLLGSFGRNAIPARHSPKKSLNRNPIICPLFSLPPNHTIWIPWLRAHLLCISWVWVGGVLALMWAPLSSMFVFFYSHDIPVILPSSSATHAGLVRISHGMKGVWAFEPVLFPFLSSWIGYCLGRYFYHFSPLGFYFSCSFSYSTLGLAGCYFCHVCP